MGNGYMLQLFANQYIILFLKNTFGFLFPN